MEINFKTLLVHLLCVFFGIGTWVCVNGLWVELPLMVPTAPEAWKLPSYMSVAICLANIAPISYSIANSLWPKRVREKPMIYLTNCIGIAATILLALFWDNTVDWFGSDRSVALIVLVFFLAMVDCSSRVLYLPFMATFQEKYLTSFFIGEGLSGLVPSIFALIQGVGGNPSCVDKTFVNSTHNITTTEAVYPEPTFSVQAFFFVLLGIVCISITAFHWMNYDSVVGHAKATFTEVDPSKLSSNTTRAAPMYGATEYNNNVEKFPPKVPQLSNSSEGFQFGNCTAGAAYLLALQVLVCAFSNGVFPSIQTYSCLPYGNVAYHLAAKLSSMANPMVCFMTFFLPAPSRTSVTTSAVLGFGVAGYVLATALLSPSPPLQFQKAGEAVLVIAWIVLVALFTYVRISVATIFRSMGKNGLFWVGAVTQVGSATGALVTFFLVEYTTVFQSYFPC